MNTNLLKESTYFPPISLLTEMVGKDIAFIDIHEHYRKGSFRNKCMIASGNGPQQLIIPLKKGKNSQMPMAEVEISYDENWPKKHLSAIKTAYGKSPYFIYFFDEISEILLGKNELLFELNAKCLELISKYFKLNLNIQFTESYIEEFDGIDVRNTCLPNNFTTFSTKYYPQVFEDRFGFQNNMSCLDLLFCMGNFGMEVL